MKKLILILFISVSFICNSQIGFSYKISKPYYIFNFLESANSCQSCSSTYTNYINSSLINNAEFNKLKSDFNKINTNYSFTINNLPSNRKNNRYIHDLIVSNLINSETITEFRNKSFGILPNYDLQSLVSNLEKAEEFYNKYVWEKSEAKTLEIINQATAYNDIINKISPKIAHFYNTSMFSDIPYTIAFYPIPVQKGNSTATPHTNSLSIGFLAEKKEDLPGVLGVAIHEMSHVLYNEQSAAFQNELTKYFKENKSEYSDLANNFFDEALATAIGNGWAYKKMSGKLDGNDWYDNTYINDFAHKIYPMVEEYLEQGKQLDKTFIDKSIALFAKKFPESIYSFDVLMNNVIIYSDEEGNEKANEILNLVKSKFKMSHYGMSSPILHEYSLEDLRNSTSTQFIIINKNEKENMTKLSEIFIQLKGLELQENAAYTFKNTNRVVILIKYDKSTDLETLINKIKEQKYYNPKSIIQTKI